MSEPVSIFLSYAHSDERRVTELYERLSHEGFRPWMDKRDLKAGESWKRRIIREIENADLFVVVLSPSSVNKRGFLQTEIKTALDFWKSKLPDDIYVIPVRLEDCAVPDDLGEFHWVDIFEDGGWEKLIQGINEGAQRQGTAEIDEREPSANELPDGEIDDVQISDSRKTSPSITFFESFGKTIMITRRSLKFYSKSDIWCTL